MIAPGSSERGLSEVTIARSESAGAGPPHLRPLVAVAVAAGAEDRRSARPSVSRRAARSTFSSESGVWA